MMKLELPFLLFFLTLSACKSRTPREVFNRPLFNKCLTLEKVGYYACNGVVKKIPVGLIVPESLDDYEAATSYSEKREYGHYICLLYPNKCSINP